MSQTTLEQYLELINNAKVYDIAIKTPLQAAPLLSERLNNRVSIKREDLQPVFSFKLRGAYNRMAHLSDSERKAGVICASAGNHAQGVAMSAQRLGLSATIVMPCTTPSIKVNAVKRLGGKVVLHGDAFDDAGAYAKQLAAETGATFVHPYDEPLVIAGQGTIAKEILEQSSGDVPAAVFVPVGGGGLVAGVAAYIKQVAPEVKVIGVEPDDAPTLFSAVKAGEPVDLDKVGIFVDGVAVRRIGTENFSLVKDLVDDTILVSADEVCAAIADTFDDTRSMPEPAGALAVAGLKKYVEETGVQQQHLVAIESGANINFHRLRYVSERAELGERRETLLAVTIPERPGSFKTFCNIIGRRAITEFNYRFADTSDAHVFVGVALQNGDEEKQSLIASLEAGGYPVLDLSDNEMAKVHIRYMVGGRAENVSGEQHRELLYRFEFPERPGALTEFLDTLGQRWNISLFHYRNHGSAFGRVLVGLQVPHGQRETVQAALDELGYRYQNESENQAYQLFLA